MKLSASRKWGYTHVKASRVLRVAQIHGIPSGGLPEQRQYQAEWLYCEKGDLAIEICKAGRKGKVLGYSYLTGPATQAINYRPAQTSWFEEEPVEVRRIEMTPSMEFPKLIENARNAPNRITVFSIRLASREEAQGFVGVLTHYWKNASSPSATGHLLGRCLIGRKQGGISLHLQPPARAGEYGATPFQIGLLLEMTKKQHEA